MMALIIELRFSAAHAQLSHCIKTLVRTIWKKEMEHFDFNVEITCKHKLNRRDESIFYL